MPQRRRKVQHRTLCMAHLVLLLFINFLLVRSQLISVEFHGNHSTTWIVSILNLLQQTVHCDTKCRATQLIDMELRNGIVDLHTNVSILRYIIDL